MTTTYHLVPQIPLQPNIPPYLPTTPARNTHICCLLFLEPNCCVSPEDFVPLSLGPRALTMLLVERWGAPPSLKTHLQYLVLLLKSIMVLNSTALLLCMVLPQLLP